MDLVPEVNKSLLEPGSKLNGNFFSLLLAMVASVLSGRGSGLRGDIIKTEGRPGSENIRMTQELIIGQLTGINHWEVQPAALYQVTDNRKFITRYIMKLLYL